MFERFNGNVVPFADESTSTNRTVFGSETQSDDIDDNLNSDFKKGWEIVGLNDNPTREDFNAMGYTLGYLTSYLYQNGVAEYSSLQEYKTNSIAIGTDGNIYQSLVDNNIGNVLTDATKWVCIASKNSIVNSIDELKTISNIESINVLGYYEKGDGGGGTFYWDATSTEDDNGGTIIQATGITTGRWKRVFSGAVNVKWFGAKGDGVTDDTLSLNNLSSYLNTLTEVDIKFNQKETYLISHSSLLQKDDYSSYIFNLNDKNKISIKGNGATIKLVNHNISSNKGFTFILANNSSNIEVNNFIFDFTFTGVNTSALYYPQCCGIKVVGTCKNVNISDNEFSMFHPYGQMALSGTNYMGDTNNGFKIIPIAVFGDTSETNYMNLTKNVNISNNVFLETHNGYGIWIYASTNVNIEKNKALKWVGKSSDQNGNLIYGSFPFIRYIQFYGQNISIVNNIFNARSKTDRPVGYEGACNFISLSQNITSSVPYNYNVNIFGNSAKIEATENAISDSSVGIYLMLAGRINIIGNTLKIISNSASFPSYAIKEDNGLEYSGITRDIIINGNFISGLIGLDHGVYLQNSYNVNNNKMNLILSKNIFDGFVQSVSLGAKNATYHGLSTCLIDGNNFINQTNSIQISNSSSSATGSIVNNLSDTGTFIVSGWDLANKSNIIFSNNKYSNLGSSITQDNTSYQSINLMKGKGSQFSLYLQNINGNGLSFVNQDASQYIFSSGYLILAPTSLEVRPYSDNTTKLGSPTYRWSTIYAGTGAINTSDDREKTYLEITEIEKQVALELKSNMKKFKFNSSIEEKGKDKARIHFGASSQTVKSIFEKYNLNAFDYAILCYDEWEEQEELKDENGDIVQEHRQSGNRYGLRYEELLSFIIGCI